MTDRYELDRDQMWLPTDPQMMEPITLTDDDFDHFIEVCYAASEASDYLKEAAKEVIDFVEVSPEVDDALFHILKQG